MLALHVLNTAWKAALNLKPSRKLTFKNYSQLAPIKMSSVVNSHIQVLGTGASELAPAFYLFTDSKRYLFNSGENLQRIRNEFRPPLTKLSVFVTHVSWRNLGGLPGMVMTSRDQGVANINLHGPELLEEFAELTRYFVGRKKIRLVTPWSRLEGDIEPKLSDIYEDENVRIQTIPLQSSVTASLCYSDGESSPDDESAEEPKVKRRKIVRSSTNNTAAFVCKLCDVRGKFDVQKAKALGIPPSPLYKKLQKGECVTTPAGVIVHPHEVLGPPNIGPVMIVVECPDESYVPSLVSNPALQSESFSAASQTVALMVHMSPVDVLHSKRFQEWMASFGPDTKHLILNENMCPEEFTLRRSLKIQFPLHLMNPSVYHPLVTSHDRTSTSGDFEPSLKDSVIYGRALLKYHLKPSHKIGVDEITLLKPLHDEYQDHLSEIKAIKPLQEAIVESRLKPDRIPDSEVFKVPTSPLIPRLESDKDAVVTFLGTGSAAPTCYRTVTGILIQTTTSGNLLFDCGEGSLSQIYRCFGKQVGDDIIRNVTGVFISHIHGDHQLGLLSVLLRKEELNGSKLTKEDRPLIIGPQIYLDWLKRYSRNCQQVSYRSVTCKSLVESEKIGYVARGLFGPKLKDVDFLTVPVIHCNSSYGVVMKHSSNWSIVYSGDTRPCQELVRAGKGATLLIHEATFEDKMFKDAKTKMHCTFGESLKISSQMNPKFTLMTHFSSRYPRIPSVLMDSRVHSQVGIAFDCMSVRLSELDSLHSYLPSMKQIFTHIIGTEEKAGKGDTMVPSQDWGEEELTVSHA